ncbi:MAG: substrate-binding domain-containing protein [Acidobacteriota bacterium]
MSHATRRGLAAERTRRLARLFVLPLALALSAAATAGQSAPARLRLATTTSVDNSGLLAAILPTFERTAHVKVDVLAVGSGQALGLLKRGDAAAGLTHDPNAEASTLDAWVITSYRKIMFNDFIIVGPKEDPAGVAHASNAIDAMRRIAASGALFASRGDASGTYSREQQLWALAKQQPVRGGLLETGQGMSATLRVASEKLAYTLTDRATFEEVRSGLRLALLYEGGPDLLNTYAFFLRAGLTRTEREAATALGEWLADGDGRRLIAGYLAHGQAVFTIWPPGTPRSRPTDLPNAR